MLRGSRSSASIAVRSQPEWCVRTVSGRRNSLASFGTGQSTASGTRRLRKQESGGRSQGLRVEGEELGDDLAHGAGAVAEDAFDSGGELAEGAVALDDFEERVVAEAAAAGRLRQDAAAAGANAFGTDLAGGVGEGGVAGVEGPAIVGRDALETFQQQRVVAFVGRAGIGEAGGIDAGRAAESFDREAAVFTQDPLAEVLSLLRRFQAGVFSEGGAGFFDFDRGGKIGEGFEREAVRREELFELAEFFTVVSAEDKDAGHEQYLNY